VFLRAIIPGIVIAGILVILLNFLFAEADHRARMKRSARYNEWIKTIPKMPLEDQRIAQLHVLRILREGPAGEYRGPWEE